MKRYFVNLCKFSSFQKNRDFRVKPKVQILAKNFDISKKMSRKSSDKTNSPKIVLCDVSYKEFNTVLKPEMFLRTL